MPHHARPAHKKRFPVHVTLRARKRLPSFRAPLIHQMVLRVIARQRKRAYAEAFQIVHFSIQNDHFHMIVEANAEAYAGALRRGISGFVIAFARRLNGLLGRTGKVWAERYHRHDLATPREVHRALRYVFLNSKKHGDAYLGEGLVDPFSSARHFDGWDRPIVTMVWNATEPWEGAPARTWLLGKGWRVHGPISPHDALPTATRRS